MNKRQTVLWDMVLEWDEGCHHDNCLIQKLSFNFRDNLVAATREADRLRALLVRACSASLDQCQLVYLGKHAALEKYLAERRVFIERDLREKDDTIARMKKKTKVKAKNKTKIRKSKDRDKIQSFRVLG